MPHRWHLIIVLPMSTKPRFFKRFSLLKLLLSNNYIWASFKKRVILDKLMDSAVRLGGNIELFGVENLDHATMIVLKKIIGTYARKFSEKGLDRLSVSFSVPEIKIEAVSQGNTFLSSASHSNVFFGVDAALKGIEKQI